MRELRTDEENNKLNFLEQLSLELNLMPTGLNSNERVLISGIILFCISVKLIVDNNDEILTIAALLSLIAISSMAIIAYSSFEKIDETLSANSLRPSLKVIKHELPKFEDDVEIREAVNKFINTCLKLNLSNNSAHTANLLKIVAQTLHESNSTVQYRKQLNEKVQEYVKVNKFEPTEYLLINSLGIEIEI